MKIELNCTMHIKGAEGKETVLGPGDQLDYDDDDALALIEQQLAFEVVERAAKPAKTASEKGSK